MTTSDITLNGKLLSEYGATLLSGWCAELMKPAEPKEWVRNEAVNGNGADYIVPTDDIIKLKERTLTLTFLITGNDELLFLLRYNYFIRTLRNGEVTLNVPAIGRTYTLKYEGGTPFDMFNLTSCKLAVKFKEPKPYL